MSIFKGGQAGKVPVFKFYHRHALPDWRLPGHKHRGYRSQHHHHAEPADGLVEILHEVDDRFLKSVWQRSLLPEIRRQSTRRQGQVARVERDPFVRRLWAMIQAMGSVPPCG